MAKKKKAEARVRTKNIFVLRGTDEWKVWLDELAAANSAPVTVTVEQALKDYALKLGFRKPPRRTP
jgi:predicted transcriptional regulator